jgi:hypothetical protein
MTTTARKPRIFTFFAVGAAIVVFAGFARSWYLKAWFGTPELPPLVHVHGAVMTLWFVLYVLQASLIATHRVALHRRIGMLGVALAALVLLIGTHTAIEAARLDRMPGPPLAFLAVPLGDMVVFATFFGLGLAYRHRPDIHRRMMTLASVGMLGAALFRLGIPGGLAGTIGVIFAILAACVAADWLVHRRPHRAFAIGALLIALSWPLRLWLSGTTAWQRFAGWLVA